MSLTIDLLRHGSTTRSDLLLGRTDAPLASGASEELVRQARRRSWATVVTSPLGRAQASAEIVAAAIGGGVRVDPAWAEMDFGSWDGRPIRQLDADPAYARFLLDPASTAPPGGDTWHDFVQRLEGALLQRMIRDDPREVVVTHGGVIRAILALTTGLSVDSLWRLSIAPATRVTLRCGRDAGAWWGQIIEIVQP